MAMTIDAISAACAEVNRAGIGRVAWQRRTDSDGSGRERLKGQRDGYAITKAHVSPVTFRGGTTYMMLVIWLTQEEIAANVAAGGSDRPMRNLNLGTITSLRPGA